MPRRYMVFLAMACLSLFALVSSGVAGMAASAVSPGNDGRFEESAPVVRSTNARPAQSPRSRRNGPPAKRVLLPTNVRPEDVGESTADVSPHVDMAGGGESASTGLPPPNDLCLSAFRMSVSVSDFAGGSTVGATTDAAPVCDFIANSTPGVWFSVLGTGSTITATTCSDFGDNPDTLISVYGGTCGRLSCVAANDDSCTDIGGIGRRSTVTWCSKANVDYLILVHDFGIESGSFRLSVFHDGAIGDASPTCGVCCGNSECLGITTEDQCMSAEGQWILGGRCALCKNACCIGDACARDAFPSECLAEGGVSHLNASCGEAPDLPAPLCVQPACGFDNGPPLDDLGSPSSQFAPDFPFGTGAADDFVLRSTGGGPCRVTNLRAWTAIISGTPGVGPSVAYQGVNVTVYADGQDKGPAGKPEDDGTHTALVPGGIVHSVTVPMTAITATPLNPSCTSDLWELDMTVDLLIPADTRYWLEVQPIMRFGSSGQTATALSNASHGGAAQQIFSAVGIIDWIDVLGNNDACPTSQPPTPPAQTRRDLAFQMSGTEIVSCELSAFPACLGDCPLDTVCSPSTLDGTCSCEPIPCGQSESPACNGECLPDSVCTEDVTGGFCKCQPVVIACCLPGGTCAELGLLGCLAEDGIPQDPNLGCANVACPQPEACCLPSEACEDVTEKECGGRGGVSRGPKTTCKLPGDIDGDGGVSQSDWTLFAECMGGPATPSGTACARADLNCDAFVDMKDVRILQDLFGR